MDGFPAAASSESSPSATLPLASTSHSPAPSRSTGGTPTHLGDAESHTPVISPAASVLASDPGQTLASFLEERYSLCHLELLFHLKDSLAGGSGLLRMPSQVGNFIDLMLRESFKTSYLMDEMLAFGAAHKSTVAHDDERVYRLESTRLQSRALAQFNSGQIQVTDGNCVAVFAFSALLGQHALFDTFSGASDLPTALEKLIGCINLHQGIRAVAGQSWEKVSRLVQTQDSPVDPAHMSAGTPASSGAGECDDLLRRLRDADMTQRTLQCYEEAVGILQYLFDTSRASDERRFIACQEWLVRVSKEFVSLLDQRRPEALVVVAFYGVLLHQARGHWAIANAGRFLIRAISSHLGQYWADWLAWPNEAI